MITKAVGNFFRMESAAGVVLFAAALFAIAAANTPALAAHYAHFLHSDVGVVIGAGVYRMSAAHFPTRKKNNAIKPSLIKCAALIR